MHEEKEEEKEKKSKEPPPESEEDDASEEEAEPTPEHQPKAPPKSMLKAKLIRIDEERKLVHLKVDGSPNATQVVNLTSFTDLWPVLPRVGDCISFPPPPGGPASTLESIADTAVAGEFLRCLREGYTRHGSHLLMRVDMYCRPHLQHLLGTKLSKKADSVHLAHHGQSIASLLSSVAT